MPAEHGHCVFWIISSLTCVTNSSTEQFNIFNKSVKFTYISSQLTASTSNVYLKYVAEFFFLCNQYLQMPLLTV